MGMQGERDIYIKFLLYIYICILRNTRSRAEGLGCSSCASRRAPSPGFDHFGPFSHGKCCSVKHPGCLLPRPQTPCQMLACTSGRSTHRPERRGTGDSGGHAGACLAEAGGMGVPLSLRPSTQGPNEGRNFRKKGWFFFSVAFFFPR